jgi:hypothetical protein
MPQRNITDFNTYQFYSDPRPIAMLDIIYGLAKRGIQQRFFGGSSFGGSTLLLELGS